MDDESETLQMPAVQDINPKMMNARGKENAPSLTIHQDGSHRLAGCEGRKTLTKVDGTFLAEKNSNHKVPCYKDAIKQAIKPLNENFQMKRN